MLRTEVRQRGLNTFIIIIMALALVVPASFVGSKDVESETQSIDINQGTTVTLLEQEISFDTAEGYDLADEWVNSESNIFLVVFNGPAENDWYEKVSDISPVLRMVNDNAVVVKLDDSQKAYVEVLDFVNWLGPYEPAFKVEQRLRTMTGKIQIEAFAFPNVGEDELSTQLKRLGSRDNEVSGYGSVICWIDSEKLPDVARLDSVSLIYHVPEMTTCNNKGSRIVRAWDVWENDDSNLPQDITGLGQIVHVQDTGLDATHWDFVRGPEGNRIVYAELTTDADGHGTALAGCALGNGYCMEQYLGLNTSNRIYNEMTTSNPAGKNDMCGFAGRAPEAELVSYAGLVSTEWDDGYAIGARIFSNSWGTGTITPGYSGTADTFMDNPAYPGSLVFFPNGNDGPASMTASGNGNGKLTLGIEACENVRPSHYTDADDPAQVSITSSRGPVSSTDLRVKPDLLEMGGLVFTTASDDSPDYSDTLNGVYSEATPIEEQQPGTCDYCYFGASSGAVAYAAGDAALIRDWLVDVQGNSNPHGNLMKTLLIHGAEDIGLGYPSYSQGWGKINVRNSIAPEAPNVLQYFDRSDLASGTWTVSSFDVTDSDYPLKVTMCHWDTVGSGTLTTDYDLIVTDPSGNTYEGNAFAESWSVPDPNWGVNTTWPSKTGGAAYNWDTSFDGGDDINNIEIVRVEEPETGTWTIEVQRKSFGNERIDVAVTCAADPALDANADPYRVSMKLEKARVVPERDDLGEGTFTSTPGGSVVVPYWMANGGTSDDDYALSAPVLPSGFSVTFVPAAPMTLDSGEKAHGFAMINVGGTVSAGAYTIELAATSNNDVASPIALASIQFNIDVVETELPPVMEPVDSKLHLDHPSVVSWGTSVGMAYLVSTEFGNHVYFVRSDDNGATWNTPVLVRESYQPGWLGLTRAVGGTYDGRLMLAYSDRAAYGYGGNTADTRANEVWVAYSSNNGDSWTNVEVYTNGEGEATSNRNSYRAISPTYSSYDSSLWIIVEDFEYSSTDMGSATWTGISIGAKKSTNGGTTWGSHIALDPDTTNRYYFFPHAYEDLEGGIALWYYERDSNDAAQDRDLKWQYYDGSWGTAVDAWDTSDNLMMMQGCAAPQGVGGNRNYCAVLRGAHTDLDRQIYIIYTDNEGASFQTNGGAGWEMSGNNIVASDSGYATRYLMDLEYTGDGQLWLNSAQLPKYDIYGSQNLFAVADNDYSTTVGRTEFFSTLDVYHKGAPRVCAVGSEIIASYEAMMDDGDMDIVVSKYSAGFMAAADITGPVVEDATTDKVYCNSGDMVYVAGNVNDIRTGGSDIQAARYYTDMDATLRTMQAVDGAFNNMEEGAISSTTPLNTAGYPHGWHTIYIQGQDSQGNWGDWFETYIYTVYTGTPPLVVVADPNGGEVLTGGGTFDIQWAMNDAEEAETALMVDIYYSTDGGGSFPNPIATGLTGLTSPCTYNWNPVPSIDSDQIRIRVVVTDTGFLIGQDDSNNDFTIDSTPPEPATYAHAELDGTGVRVYWDASPSPDIDHYEVYWSMNNWDATGDSYAGSIDAGLGTNVLHANVGINNPSTYYYQVRAYDIAGHETKTQIQAVKIGSTQTILTNPSGWFLMGLSLQVSNNSVEYLLKGFGFPASCDHLMLYRGGTWLHWASYWPPSLNTLTYILTGESFWMHVTANCRWAVAGRVLDYVVPFDAGWTFVAYPFAERSMTTADIMNDLTMNCPFYDQMLIADISEPYRIKAPDGTEIIYDSQGFIIHVTADTIWSVQNY